MPSFDIVCRLEIQEVDNAVNQTAKEISQRFDFRGSSSKIQLDKEKQLIKIVADDELKLRSLKQILQQKLAKRGIDLRFLDFGKEEEAGGNLLRLEVSLKGGLEKSETKEITKIIKESKLKVAAEIQSDQVRVSGKKIDDLQALMKVIKDKELAFPVDFINMRR